MEKCEQEKQTPLKVEYSGATTVKALDVELGEVRTFKCVPCPACGKWIVANVNRKYCEQCGQKIEWGSVDDRQNNKSF